VADYTPSPNKSETYNTCEAYSLFKIELSLLAIGYGGITAISEIIGGAVYLNFRHLILIRNYPPATL